MVGYKSHRETHRRYMRKVAAFTLLALFVGLCVVIYRRNQQ